MCITLADQVSLDLRTVQHDLRLLLSKIILATLKNRSLNEIYDDGYDDDDDDDDDDGGGGGGGGGGGDDDDDDKDDDDSDEFK